MNVIAALVPRLSAEALDMLMIHMPDAGVLPKVREALIDRFLARLESEDYPRAFALAALHGRLSEPLPPELAQTLLASASWRDYLAAPAELETGQRKTDPNPSCIPPCCCPPRPCQPSSPLSNRCRPRSTARRASLPISCWLCQPPPLLPTKGRSCRRTTTRAQAARRAVAPATRAQAAQRAVARKKRAASSCANPPKLLFAHELEVLAAEDKHARPANWRLSPRAAVDYLMGGKTKKGVEISPKYIGNRRLIETAVATLATDRALLLLGIPGTAKSWVSEHLAAAISGSSQLMVQCTAGTDENQIRYGWNYAQLLAKGPSREALVATPLMRAMEDGKIVPLRGADAHGLRHAGHAHHRAEREDAARSPSSTMPSTPRAASTSSPPPTIATRASTSYPRR